MKQSNKNTKPHYLFGKHAVLAAVDNPARKIRRVLMTAQAKKELGEFKKIPLSIVEAAHFHSILPQGAVHQGVAPDVELLEQPTIHDILDDADRPIVVLDQVTDPHN